MNKESPIRDCFVVASLLLAMTTVCVVWRTPVHAEETTTTTDVVSSTPDTTTTIDIASSTLDATTTIDVASTTPDATTTVDIASSTPDTTTTVDIASTTPTSTPPTDTSGGSQSNYNNNQAITQSEINSTVDKILNFLRSKQNAEGKIVDPGTSDWAVIAFGANGIYSADIKTGTTSLLQYIYNYDPVSELNLCAAYPRHVLALLASGVGAEDAKITELKNKMTTECVKPAGFGPDTEINDDVFGLIALTATGANPTDTDIQNIITAINAKQQTDGAFISYGWAGADITGAAINAIKYAQSRGATIDESVVVKAKNYLKTQQLTDGGWGWDASDALNTSWALMSVGMLRETQSDWFNATGKNPWHPLVNTLNAGGYYESAWSTDGVDWFGTKHAVPALLNKSWPIILPTRPDISIITGGGSSAPNPIIATPTPTSTILLATTTLAVTTSTIETATSTLTTTPIETTTTTVAASTTTARLEQGIRYEVLGIRYDTNKPYPSNPKMTSTRMLKTTAPTTTITTLNTNQIPDTKYQILNTIPLDTPTRRTAKKILAISGGSTVVLGLYLGLRLLRNVI